MNETIIVLLPLNYTFNNLLLNCCETAWISPNQMSLVEINQRPGGLWWISTRDPPETYYG